GLSAHALGEADRADRLFTRALDAVPDLDLPTGIAPKTRSAFVRAKAAWSKPIPPSPDPPASAPEATPPGPAPNLAAAAPASPALAPSAPQGESPPLYRRWWFWAGVGGAVAVGATAAIVFGHGAAQPGPCRPNSNSGCITVILPGAWGG